MIDMMLKDRYDNLYTPKGVTQPIFHLLKKDTTVWECCDSGNSWITRDLKEYGCNVISTDVEFDFLKREIEEDYDYIITNPPYSLKDRFLERCYELNKPFALLLPLTALEGIKRGDMFRRYGISLAVLDRRVDFTGKGNNWFGVGWFHYGFYLQNFIDFHKLPKETN